MIRTSALRGYDALMRQLGGDPGSMLRRYRIRPGALSDEDTLLSLRSVTSLLEASAAETDCPDFGLQLARRQDISVLGPLAVAMQHAPTVAAALNYASSYLSIQSPGLVLSIRHKSAFGPGIVELRLEVRLPGHSTRRQITELGIADLHQILMLLAGRNYALHAVTLPHSTAAPLRMYSRYFDAPVLTEQAFAGLHIGASTLEAKVASMNSMLHRIAVDYLATHYEAPDRRFSELVRQTLRQTLGTRMSSKIGVAGLLGVHPRTLQRYLADEDVTFDEIRDEVRKDLALQYLRETRIPLSQLANLLGLSAQSALTRIFRRWFGETPTRVRSQLRKRSLSRMKGRKRKPADVS